MKYIKRTFLFIIAGISAALILCFQNCAKNPNLGDYTGAATADSASTSTTGTSTSGTTGTGTTTATGTTTGTGITTGTGTTTTTVQAPMLTSTPANITVTVGQPITVTVTAVGTTLVYQWQKNAANIADTTNTLTIAAAALTDAGTYSMIISNSAGTVTATFTVTVNAAVTVVAKPVITSTAVVINGRYNDNTGVFTIPGETTAPFTLVSYTVAATGANLTYQWYHIALGSTVATAITGATQPTYSFTFNSIAQQGVYQVNVTNSGGTVSLQDGFTVTEVAGGGGGNK